MIDMMGIWKDVKGDRRKNNSINSIWRKKREKKLLKVC